MENIKDVPDVTLVQRVKETACSDSFNEISKRHSNLFYKVCQNYIKTLSALGYSSNDILEEKDIVIFEAILKFKSEKKALFSTWLGNYTRYFCLNKINAVKNMPEVSHDENFAQIFDEVSFQEHDSKQPNLNLSSIFSVLQSQKDKRILRIFQLRYDPDNRKKRTWQVIANELKLSTHSIIQLHKKGLKLIREEISRKNLDVFVDT